MIRSGWRWRAWRPGPSSLFRDPLLVAVCFAIVTMPLEISGLWFPTSLINVSRLGMLAAIGIVAWRIVFEARPLIVPPRPLLIWAAAVIVVALVSGFVTRWPNAGRELAPVLFYAAFAVAVVQALTDRRRLLVAGACLLAAGAAEVGVILAQQAGGFYLTQIREFEGRRNGTFIEPNITARFLVLVVVVALAAARRPISRQPARALALIALLTVAVVLTLSRSGWLLLLFVALAWAILGMRDRRAWLGSLAVIATFGIGLLIVPNALTRAGDLPPPASGSAPLAAPADTGLLASLALAPPPGPPAPADEPPAASTPLDGILNAAPVDVIRRYLARAGIAMFLDHPLAGVGLGGFQPMILGPYYEFIPLGNRPAPVTLAHTDLIRIAAEEGLIGLATFAMFAGGIGATIRRARRAGDGLDQVALAATGLGLVVLFLAAQTEGRFFNDPYVWLLIGSLGALAVMVRQARPEEATDGVPGIASDRGDDGPLMFPRRRVAAMAAAARAEPTLALLVLIILTLPLEFTRPWFPTGSLDLARIGMLAGFAWLGRRTLTGKLRAWPWRPIAMAAVLVIVVDLVSLVLFRWPTAPKHVVAVLAFAGFALFVSQVVDDRRRLRIVLLTMVVAGVLEGLVIVAQEIGNFYLWATPQLEFYGRRNGTFVDPNLAARMLVISIVVGFGLVASRASPDRLRAALVGAAGIVGLGVVLTLSRTGYVLLGAATVGWLLFVRPSRLGALGPIVVVVAFAVGLVAAPNALVRGSDVPLPGEEPGVASPSGPVADRVPSPLDMFVASIPLDEVRRYLAQGGVAMFEDHPVFGVGLGGFQPNLLGPYRSYIPYEDLTGAISLQHMDVLRVASEEGAIGLVAWSALLIGIGITLVGALRAATADRPLVWAMGAGIAVILLASQTEGRFYTDPYLWLLIGLLAGAWRHASAPDSAPKPDATQPATGAPPLGQAG
ncbi:MAG: O-antigen ligase family protein [Chloroflexota bacterium]